MDRPLPFIVSDDDGKPLVTDEMRAVLCSEEAQAGGPLVVVAVAGLYRTGKSYLMDRLAMVPEGRSGFPLGGTVQSQTKGIWAWLRPHPVQAGRQLLLLDTEGLADPERGSRQHDTWIFVMAVLLSNILVYNSRGTIDNESLHGLHLVAELSDHLSTKSGGGGGKDDDAEEEEEDDDGELGRVFPKFIWAVRDFMLLCEIDGRPASPDEYLEWGLKLKKGNKKATNEANTIKTALRSFFPDRHCFLFPMPVHDEVMMRNLDKAREEDLTPAFKKVSQEFVDHVLGQTQAKRVQGKDVSGSMFVSLADCYVDAIRSNALPCIEDATKAVARQENAKATKAALECYDGMWDDMRLPVPGIALQNRHAEAQKRALAEFKARAIFDKEQEEAKKVGLMLDERLNRRMMANVQASNEASSGAIRMLYEPVFQNMNEGVYMQKGGYSAYNADMERLKQQYQDMQGLGDEKDKVLIAFLSDKEQERSAILHADKKLDREQKRTEAERVRREEEERKTKVMADELERTREEQARMVQSMEEGMETMKEEMRADAERQKDEMRKTIEKDKEESLRLLKEGFQDKSDMLNSKIEQLTQSLADKDSEMLKSQQDFQREMMTRLEKQGQDHQRAMNEMMKKMQQPPVVVRKRGCSIQ